MSKSVLSAGDELREVLIEDESLSALIGEKVFPKVAPADTNGAFITYRMTKFKQLRTKFGVYDQQAMFEFMICSPDNDDCVEIAEAFCDVMTNRKVGGVKVGIEGGESTLTPFEIKGQAWHVMFFDVQIGDLDYHSNNNY